MQQHINDLSQYNIVGTLANEKDISVWIASNKSQPTQNSLCIINKLPYTKDNNGMFRDFFSYYSSKKSKDVQNFFATGDSFFIVFKYSKGQAIKEKFNLHTTTADYGKRCQVLNEIFMKINNISNMPLPALLCVTSPENICVDDNYNVQIVYNFNNIHKNTNVNKSMLFNNLAQIIETVLANELKSKYNVHLKMVVDKCKNSIYKSIPELIVDLEKSENFSSKNGSKSSFKIFMGKVKDTLKRYTWLEVFGLVVIVIIMVFSPLFKNNKKPMEQSTQIKEVGNLSYNTSSTNDDAKIDIIEPTESTTSSAVIEMPLPQDADIDFEDYIVQNGDTLESICENYYQSKDLVKTLETFNNISRDSNLVAGTIIRLPDYTATYDYFFK